MSLRVGMHWTPTPACSVCKQCSQASSMLAQHICVHAVHSGGGRLPPQHQRDHGGACERALQPPELPRPLPAGAGLPLLMRPVLRQRLSLLLPQGSLVWAQKTLPPVLHSSLGKRLACLGSRIWRRSCSAAAPAGWRCCASLVGTHPVLHLPGAPTLLQAMVQSMDNAGIDVMVYPTWSNPPQLVGDYGSPDGEQPCPCPLACC